MRQSESRSQPAAGYFAAFFLRAAQEAFIRSDTASFSLAVIGRRFLVGVASDAVSATGVAAAAVRREEERRAAGFAGAEVPRILSTSFNALISACRLNFTLPVGDCLCYDTHELPRAVSSVGRHAQGSAERAPMGSDSSPRRVRRPGRSRRRAASPPAVARREEGAERRRHAFARPELFIRPRGLSGSNRAGAGGGRPLPEGRTARPPLPATPGYATRATWSNGQRWCVGSREDLADPPATERALPR